LKALAKHCTEAEDAAKIVGQQVTKSAAAMPFTAHAVFAAAHQAAKSFARAVGLPLQLHRGGSGEPAEEEPPGEYRTSAPPARTDPVASAGPPDRTQPISATG